MMRRKSTRNAVKTTPVDDEEPAKKRRGRRRKQRVSSKSSDSDDAPPPGDGDDGGGAAPNEDDDNGDDEEQVWQCVSSTDSTTPDGEVHKLKLCLTRAVSEQMSTTTSPEKRRRLRSSAAANDDSDNSGVDAVGNRQRDRTRSRGSSQSEEEPKGKCRGKNSSTTTTKSAPCVESDECDEPSQPIVLNVSQVTSQSPPSGTTTPTASSNICNTDRPLVSPTHYHLQHQSPHADDEGAEPTVATPPPTSNSVAADDDEETRSAVESVLVVEGGVAPADTGPAPQPSPEAAPSPPPTITTPPPTVKRKLCRIPATKPSSGEKVKRQRPSWTAAMSNVIETSSLRIDLESVQTLCPEQIEFGAEVSCESNEDNDTNNNNNDHNNNSSGGEDELAPPPPQQQQQEQDEKVEGETPSAAIQEPAPKVAPPLSPARNAPSAVLYITNLVRPFTVKQLRELLERTGPLRAEADSMWTDRIKSKCYVHYERQEDAESTRHALHGVQWPIGNGKKLIIEYGTVEDMRKAMEPAPSIENVPPSTPIAVTNNINVNADLIKSGGGLTHRRQMSIAEDGVVIVEKHQVVREWDIGKHRNSRRVHTTPSPGPDVGRRDRHDSSTAIDQTPLKLMDELFLKTKSLPSIFWQPLTPDEIAIKEQQRLVRMEEHRRRAEENIQRIQHHHHHQQQQHHHHRNEERNHHRRRF